MKFEHFVKSPNLPQGRVTRAIVSGLHNDILQSLFQYGITPFVVPKSPVLPFSICHHADMLFHHIGDENIFAAQEIATAVFPAMQAFGTNVLKTKEKMGEHYPKDAILNALRLGNRFFCNPKSVDVDLLKRCEKKGIRIVPVKQGYTRCAVGVVNEHAVITADNGLVRVFRQEGVEVLHIEAGFIELPGYSYGFIGGACGLLQKDVLAFCGSLMSHPNAADIYAFTKNYGVHIIELCSGELKDIGGILPLTEKSL